MALVIPPSPPISTPSPPTGHKSASPHCLSTSRIKQFSASTEAGNSRLSSCKYSATSSSKASTVSTRQACEERKPSARRAAIPCPAKLANRPSQSMSNRSNKFWKRRATFVSPSTTTSPANSLLGEPPRPIRAKANGEPVNVTSGSAPKLGTLSIVESLGTGKAANVRRKPKRDDFAYHGGKILVAIGGELQKTPDSIAQQPGEQLWKQV